MNTEDVIGISTLVIILVVGLYFTNRSSARQRKANSPVPADPVFAMDSAQRPTIALRAGLPWMTIILIAASLLITFNVGMGESRTDLARWIIVPPEGKGLADVFGGEIWRLFTPIFIHFGVLHLLFNMMWLWDLGGVIEIRKGRVMFGAFILVVGVIANLTQYLISDSPYFGGMSGVVYGLLGYFWILGRINPASGYALNKQTVILMLGWFVLCWTGLLGPIANWAHTAGLIAGIAWAYAESSIARK